MSRTAADVLRAARHVVVTAGAGMGVDSGLPDFRGDEGFWKAYPPYRDLEVSFVDMASPRGFHDDPPLAWGFYGHRRDLYRRTEPHVGFEILRKQLETAGGGGFVVTSNVDGQFEAAGFDPERILEVHGSIHFDQCLDRCGRGIWRADDVEVEVDESTMRAHPPLPRCPSCGSLARPNVLMFGDWDWDASRHDRQSARWRDFLAGVDLERTVVVECGAGTALPTIRRLGEDLQRRGATLIRINPRESHGPPGTISIAAGAAAALTALVE